MKKKIFAISCMLLFLVTGLSMSTAIETKKSNGIESMAYCNVSITGTATEQIVKGNFFLGFGSCFYMRVDLENDGSIEISSITNPANKIELDDSHQVHLIGFNGFYSHIIKTRINGKALLAIWG